LSPINIELSPRQGHPQNIRTLIKGLTLTGA
jgi:hypothetical protein